MLTLDEAFQHLISQRGIYQALGVNDGPVKQARYKLRHQSGVVSSELKREWLQNAGYRCGVAEMWYTPGEVLRKDYAPEKYNSLDMVEFAKFFSRQSPAARMDPMYCLEKWLRSLKKF